MMRSEATHAAANLAGHHANSCGHEARHGGRQRAHHDVVAPFMDRRVHLSSEVLGGAADASVKNR